MRDFADDEHWAGIQGEVQRELQDEMRRNEKVLCKKRFLHKKLVIPESLPLTSLLNPQS